MMLKNVLHIIDTTGPGGAESVFIQLISKLDREKLIPYVVIAGEGWVYDQLRKKGIKPIIIDSKGSFNIKYLWKLISFVRKNNIHLIHSHLLGSNTYCSLVGIVTRIPVISTFHGFVDTQEQDLLLNLRFRIINWGSSKIVFVSNHLREYFIKSTLLDFSKSEVVYNGIDVEKFKPDRNNILRKELGLTDKDILIGSIGNIRKSKGYDILLKAAALLKKNHPECKFVVIGEGEGPLYDELMSQRSRFNLESTVFFLGFRKKISILINNLDIFLLPSINEGFSISTIEAMACAVPVIVTKSGGPEEIVEDFKNGILVPCKDINQLVDGIVSLLKDSKEKKEIVDKGIESVRGKFTIEKMLAKYLKLYLDSIMSG